MSAKNETAVFGGGCFWCTEAVFLMLRGVTSVEPGYAGGTTANPTYEDVCTGRTGHAEVIRITYDPPVINYRDLLTVFFGSHDPTTVNRQGEVRQEGTRKAGAAPQDLLSDFRKSPKGVLPRYGDDVGTQYRSVIFTTSDEQANEAKQFIAELNASDEKGATIVTDVEPLTVFYPAEDYHKNYYERNTSQPYCEIIINPKLEKVQEKFADLLNDKSKQK